MKSLAVVLIMLVVIAAVAVAGSQAQPLPKTNLALRICQHPGPIAPDALRCRPVALLASPGELERELAGDLGGDWGDVGDWAYEAGGDYSDPDWIVEVARAVWEVAWRAGVVALAAELVEQAVDWAFADGDRGTGHALAPLDTTIFDPQD